MSAAGDSLATSVTTFDSIAKMNKKGMVMNLAFTISAAFTFAGHLAFTLAFDADYILPMIVGKLVAGFSSLLLSVLIYKRIFKSTEA